MHNITRVALFLLCVFAFCFSGNAQVINGYAKVTAIAGNVLTLSNVNQTAHSFTVGQYVVVMQMQGDVIGANTNNDAAFGTLSAISSTGRYEIRQIQAINGTTTVGFTSATPTSLTVSSLSGTYSTSANSSLQIITFRRMATTNFSTTGAISALDWDGNVGGVVAMEVPGTLTLNHSITANGNGFRGGSVSNNNSGPECNAANVTRYRENTATLGFKGEGIYKNTNATYNNGRAKILNGGGGGSDHNGGGGGGGNYTAGGLGGNGYNNCTANPGGGQGGITLSSVIDGGRVFMGGGGGGGQQNNSVGRNGGDGGGIILIKANQITAGTCTGVTIGANGVVPTGGNAGNDGGGGGGAGGSIVFWVNTWNIPGTCPITITASGGNGANCGDAAAHAGGGAGGQGTVIFNGPTPTTNVTVTTANGTPGCNNSSSPCNNSAGAATGSPNAGIITGSSNPLPVELLDFNVELFQGTDAFLSWKTASELNNDYFSILKSYDGENWFEIDRLDGAGNSSELLSYSYFDRGLMPGVNYYKLKQMDFNGDYAYSATRTVMIPASEVLVYPNPFQNQLTIQAEDEILAVLLFSAEGRLVTDQPGNGSGTLQVELDDIPAGTYFIEIKRAGGSTFKRILKS